MSFFPFDVCISLGLGITGENVNLKDEEGDLVTKLFVGKEIIILGIVNKLKESKVRKKNMLIYFVGGIYYLDLLFFIFPEI